MKLPGFKKKQPQVEYFLSLNIAAHKTAAILFQKNNKSLSVLSYKEAFFAKLLDHMSQEDLIASSDEVVSGLDMAIPEGAQLSKTIFALPYSWVESGKVIKEKLDFLKKLCEELELTPIGFLVPIEAVVAYIQRKEGVPLSAVVVEHSQNVAVVYVIKGGNILEIKKGTLNETGLTQTVERLLAGVTKVDVLPSKIILQDADNIEKLHQEFLAYHWTQRLPFLHVPQVTVLEKGIENEAIINGVSAQMGFEIARVVPIVEKETGGAVHTEKVIPDVTPGAADAPLPTDQPLETPPTQATEEPADTLGFFEDQDVADMEGPTPAPIVDPRHANVSPVPDIQVREYNNMNEDVQAKPEEPQQPAHTNSKMAGASGIMATVTGMIPKNMPKISIPNVPVSARLLVPVAGVVILIGAFIFAYYNYILKAEVIISSDQKLIAEEVPVVLGVSTSTSAEDRTIKLYTKSIEVDGTASKETTGKEETGKKATGTVTLYNKTEQKRTLSKGTKITGSNDLVFELTEDINIASTSAFSTSYANAKGKVEATKFGKEYNLPSNANFTVEGLAASNFFGKNDEAFAGGTKEENQVVSAKDLTALEQELIKGLESKALEQAKAQTGDNEVLVNGVMGAKLTNKKFDQKEKAKAKTVKLTATVSYDIGFYNKDDIKTFATDYAKDDIPDDYVIKDDKSEFDLRDLETDEKGGSTSANLVMKAAYSPVLKTDPLPEELKGKSGDSVDEIVKEIDGVKEVRVEYKRQLPLLPQILPLNSKNIVITVHDEG